MIVLAWIAIALLQLAALRTAAEAWHEWGLYGANTRRRNRYAFVSLVLSVAAVLTTFAVVQFTAVC